MVNPRMQGDGPPVGAPPGQIPPPGTVDEGSGDPMQDLIMFLMEIDPAFAQMVVERMAQKRMQARGAPPPLGGMPPGGEMPFAQRLAEMRRRGER